MNYHPWRCRVQDVLLALCGMQPCRCAYVSAVDVQREGHLNVNDICDDEIIITHCQNCTDIFKDTFALTCH